MPVTIKDIAAASGVSIYAVSRVLNDKPIYLVDSKRKLILETAQKMGYSPNILARNLRSKKSGMVGFVVNCISDSFHVQLIQDLNQKFSENGYSFIISTPRYGKMDYEYEQINNMLNLGCEMVLVSSRFSLHDNTEIMEKYAESIHSSGKILFIDSVIPSEKVNYVCTDNRNDTCKAVSKFIEKGIRSLKFIRAAVPMPHAIYQRIEGMKDACRSHNVPFKDDDIILFNVRDTDSEIDRLAEQIEKPSLIFFESFSGYFTQFCDAFYRRNIKPGKDVFMCGFDQPHIKEPLVSCNKYGKFFDIAIPYLQQNRNAFADEALKFLFSDKTEPLRKTINSEFVNFEILDRPDKVQE